MTADGLVEYIREGQALEEGLKKHLGSYRAKDVEQYVDKLQTQLKNMESVYQERFEEMRTSLLAMTRERDEQTERVKALEKSQKNITGQCEIYLESHGLVTMQKDQYNKFLKMETNHRTEISNITQKQALIEQENEHLTKEMAKFTQTQKELESKAEELEQIKTKFAAATKEIEELNRLIQSQSEQFELHRFQLENAEDYKQKQSDEFAQTQSELKSLELQYQLAQKTIQQLTADRDLKEKQAIKLQERFETEKNSIISHYKGMSISEQECFEAEKNSIISHYKGIVTSQQECLQRLQESFNVAMQCMEGMRIID